MLDIVFSHPTIFENEIERVNDLLESDTVDFFHLRKPEFDIIQMRAFLNELNAEFHYRIILHSYYGLITDFDLGGICLNKKSLSEMCYSDEVDKCFIQPLVLNGRNIEINRLQPNMVVYSAHTISEIENLPFDTDYVFLSPIFDSISKEGYTSNFEDLNELAAVLPTLNTRVIALGGITNNRIKDLEKTGFAGIARLGDVWTNF